MLELDDDRTIPLWAYGWLIMSAEQQRGVLAVLDASALMMRDPTPARYAADALRGIAAEYEREK